MQRNIPTLNLPTTLDFDIDLLNQRLMESLNIRIKEYSQQEYSFADLTHPQKCFQILMKFSSKIEAVSLTCASSMFMKYWAVPLLYPFLYALLTQRVNLAWSMRHISTDLSPNWFWNRELLITPPNSICFYTDKFQFEEFIFIIFNDLKKIFKSVSQVGKVKQQLLWENTALRILQFYDAMAVKDNLKMYQRKMQIQRQFLNDISAEYFGLKENPFKALEINRDMHLNIYRRKKCCFYFQLPESSNEYCASCPLNQSEKLKS